MRIIRFIFFVCFIFILLLAGFVAWFCTGSFVYQNSMQKEFVIDAPISVVCKRAMNIKPKPESEDRHFPKIDMKQAAKNYSLGKPIEIEFEHPKLGPIKAGIQINLEAEPNSLKIRGKVVSLDPSQIKKFGKTVADIENFTFALKIAAKDATGGNLGFMSLLSNSGQTVLELTSDSDVRVHFRELGILRSRIDGMAAKTQREIVQEVEKFLDENLRKPGEEELTQQNGAEDKVSRGLNFLNRLNQGAKAVMKDSSKNAEPPKQTATVNDDDIDVSVLDEE
ncbi:MAG: hypothetical protein Q4A17_12620 [Thermoguttaceae bacterium]|nr:hypothetical protein [Thermoguttaceae bacterium]MDO4858776.1 hypothetical protein [Thermoguttaceae bacterium]